MQTVEPPDCESAAARAAAAASNSAPPPAAPSVSGGPEGDASSSSSISNNSSSNGSGNQSPAGLLNPCRQPGPVAAAVAAAVGAAAATGPLPPLATSKSVDERAGSHPSPTNQNGSSTTATKHDSSPLPASSTAPVRLPAGRAPAAAATAAAGAALKPNQNKESLSVSLNPEDANRNGETGGSRSSSSTGRSSRRGTGLAMPAREDFKETFRETLGELWSILGARPGSLGSNSGSCSSSSTGGGGGSGCSNGGGGGASGGSSTSGSGSCTAGGSGGGKLQRKTSSSSASLQDGLISPRSKGVAAAAASPSAWRPLGKASTGNGGSSAGFAAGAGPGSAAASAVAGGNANSNARVPKLAIAAALRASAPALASEPTPAPLPLSPVAVPPHTPRLVSHAAQAWPSMKLPAASTATAAAAAQPLSAAASPAASPRPGGPRARDGMEGRAPAGIDKVVEVESSSWRIHQQQQQQQPTASPLVRGLVLPDLAAGGSRAGQPDFSGRAQPLKSPSRDGAMIPNSPRAWASASGTGSRLSEGSPAPLSPSLRVGSGSEFGWTPRTPTTPGRLCQPLQQQQHGHGSAGWQQGDELIILPGGEKGAERGGNGSKVLQKQHMLTAHSSPHPMPRLMLPSALHLEGATRGATPASKPTFSLAARAAFGPGGTAAAAASGGPELRGARGADSVPLGDSPGASGGGWLRHQQPPPAMPHMVCSSSHQAGPSMGSASEGLEPASAAALRSPEPSLRPLKRGSEQERGVEEKALLSSVRECIPEILDQLLGGEGVESGAGNKGTSDAGSRLSACRSAQSLFDAAVSQFKRQLMDAVAQVDYERKNGKRQLFPGERRPASPEPAAGSAVAAAAAELPGDFCGDLAPSTDAGGGWGRDEGRLHGGGLNGAAARGFSSGARSNCSSVISSGRGDEGGMRDHPRPLPSLVEPSQELPGAEHAVGGGSGDAWNGTGGEGSHCASSSNGLEGGYRVQEGSSLVYHERQQQQQQREQEGIVAGAQSNSATQCQRSIPAPAVVEDEVPAVLSLFDDDRQLDMPTFSLDAANDDGPPPSPPPWLMADQPASFLPAFAAAAGAANLDEGPVQPVPEAAAPTTARTAAAACGRVAAHRAIGGGMTGLDFEAASGFVPLTSCDPSHEGVVGEEEDDDGEAMAAMWRDPAVTGDAVGAALATGGVNEATPPPSGFRDAGGPWAAAILASPSTPSTVAVVDDLHPVGDAHVGGAWQQQQKQQQQDPRRHCQQNEGGDFGGSSSLGGDYSPEDEPMTPLPTGRLRFSGSSGSTASGGCQSEADPAASRHYSSLSALLNSPLDLDAPEGDEDADGLLPGCAQLQQQQSQESQHFGLRQQQQHPVRFSLSRAESRADHGMSSGPDNTNSHSSSSSRRRLLGGMLSPSPSATRTLSDKVAAAAPYAFVRSDSRSSGAGAGVGAGGSSTSAAAAGCGSSSSFARMMMMDSGLPRRMKELMLFPASAAAREAAAALSGLHSDAERGAGGGGGEGLGGSTDGSSEGQAFGAVPECSNKVSTTSSSGDAGSRKRRPGGMMEEGMVDPFGCSALWGGIPEVAAPASKAARQIRSQWARTRGLTPAPDGVGDLDAGMGMGMNVNVCMPAPSSSSRQTEPLPIQAV